MVFRKKNSKFRKKMNLVWWVFVISIFFYPIFIFSMIYTDKHPNSKLTKWWKKYIVENEKDYD